MGVKCLIKLYFLVLRDHLGDSWIWELVCLVINKNKNNQTNKQKTRTFHFSHSPVLCVCVHCSQGSFRLESFHLKRLKRKITHCCLNSRLHMQLSGKAYFAPQWWWSGSLITTTYFTVKTTSPIGWLTFWWLCLLLLCLLSSWIYWWVVFYFIPYITFISKVEIWKMCPFQLQLIILTHSTCVLYFISLSTCK